jgi:type IV pilus assembly protein PilC
VQLESAATFYERELEYKIKRITTLIEPAIIVAVGIVVGFVAIALISAMYGVFHGAKV